MSRGKKKREVSPREKALASYVWFLFSLVVLAATYGLVFPDFIRYMGTAGRTGGPTADLMLGTARNARQYWQFLLAPAVLATVLWLSPADRLRVYRILYVLSLIIGLALMAGSAALFLDYFG